MRSAVPVIPPEGRASPAQVAAGVIRAIGRPDFPERLLGVYRELAGCDFCSAFSWESQDGPRLLFALGTHPEIPGFALSASRAYVNMYWRFDTKVRQGLVRACGGVSLLRMTPADIPDPNYRQYCYQRAGICERLMLFDAASPIVSISGYRTVLRGPAPPRIVQWMLEAGPTLIAAIRRHHELVEQEVASSPSRHILLTHAHELGLSAREAEIAAGLAMGRTQVEIAKRAGIAVNSVITYRRRAYQKLRVSDRQELRALCDRLAAAARLDFME